jgi:uncharacterized delta-60 repeat protein
MTNLSWIRTRPRPAARAARRRPSTRLLVEPLENRCVPAGGIDTTFGTVGKQITAFLGPTDAQVANAVAVQADGKIVTAGVFQYNALAANSSFLVARYNHDGSPDTTFGNLGKVTVKFGAASSDTATGVALQANGKIVVVGFTNATGVGANDFAVARLNSDGTLDTSFNGTGKQTVDFGFDDRASAVAIQNDQKIVVAGTDDGGAPDFAIARLNADGTLDATFNPTPLPPPPPAAGDSAHGNGKQSFTFGAGLFGGSERATSVAISPVDQKIVMGGFTDAGSAPGNPNNFAIARLNTNGTLDSTFNGNGRQTVDFGFDDRANGVAVQPDGKIVAGGFDDAGAADFAVTRLNADGTLDTTTFNPTGAGALGSAPGKLTFNFGALGVVEKANALALQTDGKIVLGGFTGFGGTPANPNNFAVARVTTGGTLDTSFNGTGLQTVDFGGDDQANALALDSRGAIVLAGQTKGAAAGATQQFALTRVMAFDLITTAGVFDPTTATWFLRNETTAGPPDIPPFQFGSPGDEPIMGDWNGDGKFTVGVFTPSTATFHLRNNNSAGPDDFTFVFGPTTADLGGKNAVPVAGDWNGDGFWSVGVFAPSRGDWNLRNELSPGLPDAGSFLFGALGSKPVVGDWNGDGKFTQGVVEPDGTWKLKDVAATGPPDHAFAYGSFSDQVLAGDWNGDGIWTPGVLEVNGGVSVWKLRNANTPGPPDITPFAYGGANVLPITGDFNFPAQPLLAADGPGPGAASISTGDLNAIFNAALGRLQQAGVSPAVLDRLAGVTAFIQPLRPGDLGDALPDQNLIYLSPDGAGHGWFVDPTPYQDEEFASGTAFAGSPAAGREDLLTTVLHELGHIAGLPDDNSSLLMAGLLPTGTRRTDGLNAVFALNSVSAALGT